MHLFKGRKGEKVGSKNIYYHLIKESCCYSNATQKLCNCKGIIGVSFLNFLVRLNWSKNWWNGSRFYKFILEVQMIVKIQSVDLQFLILKTVCQLWGFSPPAHFQHAVIHTDRAFFITTVKTRKSTPLHLDFKTLKHT